jgi:hypothetical protein
LEGAENAMVNAIIQHDIGENGRYSPSMYTSSNGNIIGENLSGTFFKMGFEHYLPKKFIDIYTGSQGGTYTLSTQETIDINPIPVSINKGFNRNNKTGEEKRFSDYLKVLKLGGSTDVNLKVSGGSRTSGALGNFTITFNGILTKNANDGEKWTFEGTMEFYDSWDFDIDTKGFTKDAKRGQGGEIVTRIANKYLVGKPFEINSLPIDVKQSSEDIYIDWFKDKKAVSVPNKLYEIMSEHPEIREALKAGDYGRAIKIYSDTKTEEKVDETIKGG